MYKYVEDKQFLSRMRSLCGEIMQDLCHTLKEEYDIGASFYLVGSGARNLILQNANRPIDLDYNLEITRIDDWEDCKEIKECVRKAFNIVLREYGWSDCQDSTSSLTTEKRHFNQGNSTEFSMDICIVCEDTDGNYHRLIHDKRCFPNRYFWNQAPNSRNIREKAKYVKEMKEFLDDLTTRDQRMMFAVITMVITADSKEQLENDTEALLTTARKHLCQFATLRFQQVDGLNTVMPFGTRKIDAFRTLTTESLSVFIPFRVQDIFHENGIYYGQNVISKNMIIADRKQLLNGNSFILGVSGGGKSFAAKGEIINQVLSSDADIIIIDPEREYSQLVNAMGGEVINISATSDNHINAMDMNKDYGDGANPVILKSEFIMSLCEQLIGGTNLGAKQKSIIDRCTASVYRSYQQNDYQGHIPTLQDFRAELLQQDEPEAKELALAIELFTHGSLNTFAKQTNVDTNNRLICYDILDLGKQLMPIGMLVVLDSILNRITQNRAKGKNTFIFIDEIYLLFQHEYSANFLFTLWKRVRKYGAYASGITQNVDDLLQSHTARTMLANSEFIIMLNQASTDRLELAKLLNISDLQMSYITNVEAGHGLIKVGSSLVPFANKFPKNTKLYKLMTTKPGEA